MGLYEAGWKMESWPEKAYMASLEPRIHPIISPVPECVFEIDVRGSWQNIQIGFWACGIITIEFPLGKI